jgi:hypothetical protein
MPLSIFVRHIPPKRYLYQGDRNPEHEVIVSGDSGGGGDGHTHANKTLLDTYNQANLDITDSISKKHINSLDHSNALDHSNSLDHANTNDPTSGEKAALVGTSGTPGSGNKFVTDGDARNTNSRSPTAHTHAPGDTTGTAVVTNDSRLSDARTPTAHNQAINTVTGLQTALDGKEPANTNIQAHVVSAHAPSNAQKNSDITKSEIEIKLTGEISTHTHAGGGDALGVFFVDL